MGEQNFAALGLALLFALVAATLRTLKRNLIQRSVESTRLRGYRFVGFLEFWLWLGAIAGTLLFAIHPIAILIVLMLVSSVIACFLLRYHEERRSLNRWLRFSIQINVPADELFDQFANGCRSGLAFRCKRCAKLLTQGHSITRAVYRSKLPLDSDAVAAFNLHHSERMLSGLNATSVSNDSLDERLASDIERESHQSGIRVQQQFIYLFATLVIAVFVGIFVRQLILPILEQTAEEFSMELPVSKFTLDIQQLLGNIACVAVVMLLITLTVSRWLPRFLLLGVPWFGKRIIDQRRAVLLKSMGLGMDAGLSETELLESSLRTARSLSIRSSSRLAKHQIACGVPLANALRQAKLVSKSEERWLQSAAKNGTLPATMVQMNNDILRRQSFRWDLRMAWFVPLATFLIGGYVLVHAWAMFTFLCNLIERLSR
ncbi:type II secretion system F family protein [Rhodopirellula sp. MGV]|uniref:type II secretion system F family protein n=1 Tax=Rhodopirellula sp. MGV TaxID=2023130 RepID=UPI000B96AAD3|nr:type II secretion system F family protein [Rhodopirellula sp. MGV]OYP34910.1 hypothetical protein CGZ80_12820 [Rhodopirellula sp. MGV]PNY38193.1 hypothetical protein C2E31_04130 [Rhodopirellula baltica]